MTTLSSSIQVQFGSLQTDAPFELVTDDNDQGGAAPVRVAWPEFVVQVDDWNKIRYQNRPFVPLDMLQPGRKRVKLFCSRTASQGLTLLVDNGPRSLILDNQNVTVNTAFSLGRRSDSVLEDLTWNGEVRKRLRFFYDQPEVEVIQKTVFRNRQGQSIDSPRYDRQRGEFFCPGEAIGAMVVRYRPAFSLFEILYDSGESVVSPEHFIEMQKAWSCGDIHATEVPPVRLIALSPAGKSDTASFERSYWPSGTPAVSVQPAQQLQTARAPTNEVWTVESASLQTMSVPIRDDSGQQIGSFEKWVSVTERGPNGSTRQVNYPNGQ
ncbi:MAG: hypothetical protein HQL56_09770 [Magnetococcales bacterium]|nr:hypothetical protein [Magnetococcales bacterium]